VGDQAVRGLGGDPAHRGPDAGQQDARGSVAGRAGVEGRGHQRVVVELAAEVQLGPVVPAGPDGAQRRDVLAHPPGRVVERLAEPAGDVRAHLGAKAELEPAAGVPVQLVGQVRGDQRVAGQGDGYRGAQGEPAGVLGGQCQRKERFRVCL
jgi:hypothetical protein